MCDVVIKYLTLGYNCIRFSPNKNDPKNDQGLAVWHY